MLITILCICAVTAGGLAITYMFEEDESFLWRLSAGSIIGSGIFGIIAFVAGCLIAFNAVTIIGSILLTMLPVLLLRQPGTKARFRHDWAKAKGKLQGADLKKGLRFAYYAFFFIVFWFFFDRACFEMKDGIYTGGSQNLGDLPLHLGAIFSFTDGNNFPPLNPSWAGAKFTYPFIADFLAACYVKLGAAFMGSLFIQNITWAMALLVILERFGARLTNSKLAGRITPALLFFSGGFGFLYFFADLGDATKGLVDFMFHLPRDYTIGDHLRWGNSMVVLFITQRGLLFGMPLTIIILGYLWRVFTTDEPDADANDKTPKYLHYLPSFVVGLIAGLLPLIHVHSLVVLFVITAFLFVIRPEKWRRWIAFGIGVVLVAVPELIWTMTGTATETSKFFGWHFGWDKRTDGFVWFWFKNTGILFPVLFAAIALYFIRLRKGVSATEPAETSKRERDADKVAGSDDDPSSLLLFYIPFATLFIVSNVVKMAPWEWDNIKVMIYWFIGSLPFIALALAWAWQHKNGVWKTAAAVCLVLLTLSGALDVWRTASGYVKSRVFDTEAIQVAEQIKQKTPTHALFLNAPTYNSAVVLAGRPSLMRYSGHLSSYGIDYGPREADVKRIYEGGGVADLNLQKYNIEYVLVSPEEKGKLKANEEFFKKYPVVAEAGQYRVYKIK